MGDVQGWVAICVTLFFGIITLIVQVARGFAALGKQLQRIETVMGLGEENGGMISELRDHEQRLRALETRTVTSKM